jgi:hypothetical protein
MSREMEVVWNGVKMGRFLFTPSGCSQQWAGRFK